MKAELQLGQLLFEEKALLWIYIFSFVFDYKGQEGGSLPQYIMAGLSIAAGTGFILFRSRRRNKNTIKLLIDFFPSSTLTTMSKIHHLANPS